MSIAGYWLLGIAIWAIGLAGLILHHSRLRRVISINLMSSGVFLIMVALAAQHTPTDPILQALVLTGLVIAVSGTAVTLKLGAVLPKDPPR